ncbi:MAG: FHA domain-containing protein [bacterium]
MALILEIRDSRGNATWHRLDALPLTIGRSLSNDIVLDDPYLDARHARIMSGSDGRLEVEDLGSVNGLIAHGVRASGPLDISAGGEIRAGRTTLRFRDAEEALPPALRDDQIASSAALKSAVTIPDALIPAGADTPLVGPLLATRARRVACCLAMLATFACNTWLSDTTRSSGSSVFGAVLGFAALVALWAALWAAAGRAVMHRFEFLAHAAVASLGMLAMLAWGTVNEWLTFLYPDAKTAWVLYMVVFLVVLATLISAHLALATALPWKRQRKTGVIVAGGVVALLVVSALVTDDKFTDVPKFANQLKPMSARWVPATSVSEFGEAARELRDEVDEDAKKTVTP